MVSRDNKPEEGGKWRERACPDQAQLIIKVLSDLNWIVFFYFISRQARFAYIIFVFVTERIRSYVIDILLKYCEYVVL